MSFAVPKPCSRGTTPLQVLTTTKLEVTITKWTKTQYEPKKIQDLLEGYIKNPSDFLDLKELNLTSLPDIWDEAPLQQR